MYCLICRLHYVLKSAKLQNPQLVTSYALPPDASFTAAPYSIYRKGSSKIPTQRFTYASLAGSPSVDKSQLVCFHEKSLGENTETVKTTYVPSATAHVLTLESLPVSAGGSAKDPTHDVLATCDNGDVICLSANLDTVRWVANVKSLFLSGGPNAELEHVTLVNAKAVTRGLLRDREDIATILNPSRDEASDLLDLTQVLCLISRRANGVRKATLVHIQPRSPDLPTSQLVPLKLLLSWNLPNPSKTSATVTSQFILHASSGMLHALSNGTLLSYDLSGTIPKLQSELSPLGSSIDSFVRISQDLLFTASQQTCRVFDAKYNSLQALLSIDADIGAPNPASPSKKRKHTQPADSKVTLHCNLVTYYADLGLVIAARDNELLGMQYASHTVSRKRVKSEGTLLIDALGKGLASRTKPAAGYGATAWQGRKGKLDKYASKGKIVKFEQTFAADLNIELELLDHTKKQKNEIRGGPLTNGVGPKVPDEDAMAIDKPDDNSLDGELRKWKIPQVVPDHQQQRYRQYALYALSKIFRWITSDVTQGSSRGSLRIEFFAPNVFQWLLQVGHLTKESIRRAILDERPDDDQAVLNIADGDIVKALVDFDGDFHILSAVLNHSHFLPIGEVVQAIKLLMQSLGDAQEDSEGTKLLTNGTMPSDETMDVDIASELDAASHEIEHALSILDHGLTTRSHTLRPALIRLHTFAAPVVSATLRSMLPRKDLESLICLLHLELRNGGWSSTYDSADTDSSFVETSTESPDDHAVAIVASLLSSTLDSVGAGAWLASVGSLATTGTSEDIIQSLRNDTSEALNGFWEARYMRGLLSEFLRYASTVPKSQRSNKRLELQGKPFVVTGKLDGEDLPMLPLGSKADMGPEKTKKGPGGKKEERSKREMGMLISKRVPKYSFERIVI